jgi:hypothetical protein
LAGGRGTDASGQQVADVNVRDAKPEVSDTTSAVLSHQIQRLINDSLQQDIFCADLAAINPSTAEFHVSEPDVTYACEEVAAAERQAKLLQILTDTSAIALSVLLYKIDWNHLYCPGQDCYDRTRTQSRTLIRIRSRVPSSRVRGICCSSASTTCGMACRRSFRRS